MPNDETLYAGRPNYHASSVYGQIQRAQKVFVFDKSHWRRGPADA